ncbi:MAG: hypothetical protein NVSMB9_34630 [Isosphaeraceae bacterium]
MARQCVRKTIPNRRDILRAAGLGMAGSLWSGPRLEAREPSDRNRLKVAAVVTEFTYRSHAHVLLENFLEPYLFNGKRTDPGMDLVSLYVDQFPDKDMSRDVAKKYKFPIFPTIAEALCLGGKTLAVDAVLSIAEHGKYPVNAKGQHEYPRKRFFDEIIAVYEASGRVAPVFNDKHLSYRWDWAREMVDTARRLKVPFMAGSSVPLAERRPSMELPPGAEVLGAVSIHGGPVESYDFHGLEVLASVIEARRGGESGIASVQFLEGHDLWESADAGLWSVKLADRAMAAELGPETPTLRDLVKTPPFRGQPPHGILLQYRDGLRAIVLGIGSSGTRWNFACLAQGVPEPLVTSFYTGPWENRNLFKALAHAIQVHFRARQPPYPVERTLLVTGVLDAAMDSKLAQGKVIPTPHLEFAYTPIDFRSVREMGATWKLLTPDTPQPPGIDTSGRRLGG